MFDQDPNECVTISGSDFAQLCDEAKKVSTLLNKLNTFGVSLVRKQDVYNYLMGDDKALDKYAGDPAI